MAILTEEQKDVVRKVLKGRNNDQVASIGGRAGTGKSTILRFLADKLDTWGVSAYTGKAANILRKKGIARAQTIHSAIYKPERQDDGTVIFYLRDPGYDGYLIDEASMVGEDIHLDLFSFGKPIIYIGDHGQLEPINSNLNLMKDPMYCLETIHRNAGEIAFFAEHLRKGLPPQTFPCEKKVQVVRASAILDRHLASVDQIVCAFNNTRVNLNRKVRKHLGYQKRLVVGDRVMCLRNNRNHQLFNGMQGLVAEIHSNYKFDLEADGLYFEKVPYDSRQFGKEKTETEFSQNGPIPFDYAYAGTAHKVQGDEFGTGIVYEQHCEYWDHRRYCYTGASRFKRGLIWATR